VVRGDGNHDGKGEEGPQWSRLWGFAEGGTSLGVYEKEISFITEGYFRGIL